MGDLHIYEVEGMDEYLPKQSYYGHRGRLQMFLDMFSSALFEEIDMPEIDSRKRQIWMNMMNQARNLTLLDKKKSLIVKQMNWYVNKLMHYVTCDYKSQDVLLFFEIEQINLNEIILKITDDKNEFIIKYNANEFEQFRNDEGYLKRNYSDKIKTYMFNLSELYHTYISNDELYYKSLGYYPYVKCAIHGKRAWSEGYIDWK